MGLQINQGGESPKHRRLSQLGMPGFALLLSVMLSVYCLWVAEWVLAGWMFLSTVLWLIVCRSMFLPGGDKYRKSKGSQVSLAPDPVMALHQQFEYLQSEIRDLARITADAATKVGSGFQNLQQHMQQQAQLISAMGDQGLVPGAGHEGQLQSLSKQLKMDVNSIVQAMQYDDFLQQMAMRLEQRLAALDRVLGEMLDGCKVDMPVEEMVVFVEALHALDQESVNRVCDVSRVVNGQASTGDKLELF